ncbi:MAG: efflux RND transporter periplasmic adaptor subunit [Planctomycetota bacterium]
MTTTLTSVPPVAPALSGSAATRASRATAAGRRRTLQLTFGVVIVGLLAAVVWATTSWTRAATYIANVDKFTVAPQTFTVALKEKGELKAAKSTDIKCEVEGKSTIISLIDEGTNVKEGDLLVELASDEIVERIRQEELTESNAITAFEAAKTELDIQRDQNASNIRKAELQIELKRLELDKYEKGDWEQKLKDARIAIEQATISLQRRDQDYNASKELYAKKFITQTEYQEDEFNFKKAQWDLDKANKAIEVLETYTHVAELRQKQSDLEEATKECERVKKNAEAEEVKKVRASEGKEKELALTQDKLAKLRGQKEKCRIFAPTQGFVVYYNEDRRWGMSESQMKVGASVIERQILMQLPDTSKMTAVVRVHEAKTDKLHLGQSAMVSVEGLPGKRFPGSVTKIAALADSKSGWLNPDLKEYETEITLDPTEDRLKPGVTAQAEIMVETVEGKLAVPVQALYTKGGQRYVFRDGGSGTAYVPVQTGAIGTEWAEIADGLSAGDKIRLAFSDDDKRAIPDAAPGDKADAVKRIGRRPPADGAAAQPQSGQAPAGGAAGTPPGGRTRRDRASGSGGAAGQSQSGKKP